MGAGGLSYVVVTFTHVGGSFNLCMATTGDVWIIPCFRIRRLCAACWARFICHHELWSTSVSHPFSSFNSSLSLTGGKYYKKYYLILILQNIAFPGYFSYILFYPYPFTLLSSGSFVIATCGSIGVSELVKFLSYCKLMRYTLFCVDLSHLPGAPFTNMV